MSPCDTSTQSTLFAHPNIYHLARCAYHGPVRPAQGKAGPEHREGSGGGHAAQVHAQAQHHEGIVQKLGYGEARGRGGKGNKKRGRMPGMIKSSTIK